jgi:hypothetical protein
MLRTLSAAAFALIFAGPADAAKQAPVMQEAATQGIGQGRYDKIVNDCRFGGTDNDNSIGVGLITIGRKILRNIRSSR